MDGGSGGDTLKGGSGDDELIGGSGGDDLHGGRDDDMLTGGDGNDTFYFRRNAGDDVITDFENGSDLIDLSAYGLRPADFATVVAPALSNAGGGDTFLDLDAIGGSGSVLIEGLAFADADAMDFVFVRYYARVRCQSHPGRFISSSFLIRRSPARFPTTGVAR